MFAQLTSIFDVYVYLSLVCCFARNEIRFYHCAEFVSSVLFKKKILSAFQGIMRQFVNIELQFMGIAYVIHEIA